MTDVQSPAAMAEVQLHGPDGGTVLARAVPSGFVTEAGGRRRARFDVAIEACNLASLPESDLLLVPCTGPAVTTHEHTPGLARELAWLVLAQLADAGNDPGEWWTMATLDLGMIDRQTHTPAIATAAGRQRAQDTLRQLEVGQRHLPTLDRYAPMMRQATGNGEGCCVPRLELRSADSVCGRDTEQGRGLCDAHRTHGPMREDAIMVNLLADWQRAEARP